MTPPKPSPQNQEPSTAVSRHIQRLLNSYRHWTGRELLERRGGPQAQAAAVDAAPFVLVSHGSEADPILNYGNRLALEMWELDFASLTRMPSRLTAEPMHQDERAQFMARVKRDGFVSGYQGIRSSSSGRRFRIEEALIWNVLDEHATVCGQAASFSKWTRL